MRSFIAGSLALIALWVAVQPDTANKIGIANSALIVAVRRLLSPDVAGVPDRSKTPARPAAQSQSSSPSQEIWT
jgi:hypothetical protein